MQILINILTNGSCITHEKKKVTHLFNSLSTLFIILSVFFVYINPTHLEYEVDSLVECTSRFLLLLGISNLDTIRYNSSTVSYMPYWTSLCVLRRTCRQSSL